MSTIKSTIFEIDTTLSSLIETISKLETTNEKYEELLFEAQIRQELSNNRNDDLNYGIIIDEIQEKMEVGTNLLKNNVLHYENLKLSKQTLESLLKSSGEKIAYINVKIKIGQSEQQLIVNPDFKIIK